MRDVRLKSRNDIAGILRSCKIVANLLVEIESLIRPGVTTLELDNWAESFIKGFDAVPSFKGYRGFPATLCVSINDEIVHGIPSGRRIAEGDIVKIDVGSILNGRYSDAAKTYPVGTVDDRTCKLIEATEKSFYAGVAAIQNGAFLTDIGRSIQDTIQSYGFKVIRDLTGHGVGFSQHEAPTVYNYVVPEEDLKLRNGMVLAIEPMASIGTEKIFAASDGWTLKTLDGSLSAHYEHTVAIWDGKPFILTSLDCEEVNDVFGGC